MKSCFLVVDLALLIFLVRMLNKDAQKYYILKYLLLLSIFSVFVMKCYLQACVLSAPVAKKNPNKRVVVRGKSNI
jgi:hypothetical protein